MKKAIYVVLLALGIVAGVGLDILFFVRGVEEVMRGFSAHPHSGHDIAWGLVNIIWRDVFTSVLFFAYAALLTVLFWGKSLHRASKQVREPSLPW